MEIRGGIVGRSSVARTASPISVTWQWYNLSQGVVEWEFTNKGNNTAGCLLFRNSYYFGNAFFPVYLANPQFNTSFATAFSPLVDRGAQNNSAPLSVIDFGQNRRIVAFVFILCSAMRLRDDRQFQYRIRSRPGLPMGCTDKHNHEGIQPQSQGIQRDNRGFSISRVFATLPWGQHYTVIGHPCSCVALQFSFLSHWTISPI
ncbi:hypothetical protein ApAK_00530 [Thermoplasmatales archaeon AK]|nr:hypothetical protein [Thermoplasmatales archaeon AK]